MSGPHYDTSLKQHIVIIGNGIAGITAARHIRKLGDHEITVISSESEYFFSRTALMYVYMGHMRQKDIEPYEPWFWDKNHIHLVHDHVIQIQDTHKRLMTTSGREIQYDKLIIACGSVSNALHIPGINGKGVTGLYSLQDLRYIDSMSSGIKKAIIIGGGLIGIELAEMLHSRQIPVTYLVRESAFWDIVLPVEEAEMVNQEIIEHGIDLKLNTELHEIKLTGDGSVNAVITIDRDEIPCEMVGVTVGVRPNIDWLKGSALELNKGILVDEHLRTNIPDVFAIGDCAELRNVPPGRQAIEAIWYTGRIMGETVAYTISGHETSYQPGLWFNSAKFFTIEYQVYGEIQMFLPDHQRTLFWQHEDGKKSIRINYHENGTVIGFNLMGVRFRQEVCEKWISQKWNMEEVLQSLELAMFDPEFSENFAPYVRGQFQKITGRIIKAKTNRKYDKVFRFLNPGKISAT